MSHAALLPFPLAALSRFPLPYPKFFPIPPPLTPSNPNPHPLTIKEEGIDSGGRLNKRVIRTLYSLLLLSFLLLLLPL